MIGNTFAMHSQPVNRNALYVVYRAGSGYSHDAYVDKCPEYEDCVRALKYEEKKLSAVKELLKIANAENDIDKIQELTDLRTKIKRKWGWLSHEKQRIKEKYGVIKSYGKELTFNSLLLEELFKSIGQERFHAAVRSAKERYHELNNTGEGTND